MSVGTTALIAGAAVIGGGTALAGGIMSANAQGAAGAAQLAAAKDALQAQIQARTSGIAEAKASAAMSAGEIKSADQILQTRDQALSSSMASIQKQQTMLDQVAPNVQAAGQNLYSLLTGKSAEILAPMQTQLNNQRQQLVNKLSSQMGPGFMTSSAGMQALTQFDNQASLTLNSAQMSAIQTVGAQYGALAGLQQQGQAGITSSTMNAFSQAQTANTGVLQAYQFAQNRETGAVLGAMGSNQLNPFGVAASAGAPYAGQAALGGTISQLGQGIGAFGGSLAGMSMMNGAGGGGAGGGGANPFAASTGGGYSPSLGVNTSMPNLPQGTGQYAF